MLSLRSIRRVERYGGKGFSLGVGKFIIVFIGLRKFWGKIFWGRRR